MGLFDFIPRLFGRGSSREPARRDEPERWPLDGEKLKTAVPIPAFLPYFDEQQTAGETAQMRMAYRHMLADPFVKSAMLGKILSVMSAELQVRPPEKYKKVQRYQQIAEFVEWNLTEAFEGGMPALVWAILSGALIDGFSVCEKVWEVEDEGQWKGKRILVDLKPKDVNQDLVVNINEFKKIISIRGLRYNAGEEFSPRDFVIYQHLPLYGNPTGMSDFRAAYGAYWIRDTVKKLRGMGAERLSFPTVVAELGSDNSKLAALERALGLMKSRSWAVVPQAVKLQVLDLAGSGPDKLANLDKDLKEEIVTAIAGSTLPTMTSGEGQSRGDSTVHKDKADLFSWHLHAALLQIMNGRKTGLIREMVGRNFADVDQYPKAILGGIDEAELKEELEIDKGLDQMGWELDEEETQERYGRKMKRKAVVPPGMQPPGGPTLPGAQPTAAPPIPGPDAAGGPANAVGAIPAGQDDGSAAGDPAEQADLMADIVGGTLGGETGDGEPGPGGDPESAGEEADALVDIAGGLYGDDAPAVVDKWIHG